MRHHSGRVTLLAWLRSGRCMVARAKRGAEVINEARWLSSRLNRPDVKQSSLIAPAIPTGLCFAAKKFEIRPSHKPLNMLPDAIWFPAMLATPFHDKPLHVFGAMLWFPACSEQTQFWICARPISEAGKEIGFVLRYAEDREHLPSCSAARATIAWSTASRPRRSLCVRTCAASAETSSGAGLRKW